MEGKSETKVTYGNEIAQWLTKYNICVFSLINFSLWVISELEFKNDANNSVEQILTFFLPKKLLISILIDFFKLISNM